MFAEYLKVSLLKDVYLPRITKFHLRGTAVNLELYYVLIALIMVFFFYRRHLLYLLQDKKQTMQMLLIFALVACLVYVICDYVLDVIPNNIRS